MSKISEIVELLRGEKDGKISLFCGAGISVNSGIPATSILLENILVKLGLEPIDLKALKRGDGNWLMPFEAFMEAFIEHDKNTRLFEIFLLGKPNLYHYLIKLLAAKGKLDEILTTNFDLLLERMFDSFPSILYKIVLETDTDVQEDFRRPDIVFIVKLHGTAGEVSSIRSTIFSINSGKGFESRKILIKNTFNSSSETILFLGYSFSDVFDINPAIEMIQPTDDKQIIIIKHDPGISEIGNAIVVPLAQIDENNPLRKFVGYLVRVDSNILVKHILKGQVIEDEYADKSTEWQSIIDKWISSFTHEHIKYSILCHLFYLTAQYDLALKYSSLAIRLNGGKDKRGEGAALSNRGMIYYSTGRIRNALAEFHKALRIFIAINYPFGVATCYINLAYAYSNNGNISRGLKFVQIGISFVAQREFNEAQLCFGHFYRTHGEINLLEKRYADAETNFELSLKYFRPNYKGEESEVLMLKGKLRLLSGNLSESAKYMEEAISLANKTGRKDVIKECSRLGYK